VPHPKEIIMSTEYVTVAEAADIAGRGIPTVYRWLRNGTLTRYRIGVGATVISRSELDALLTPRPDPVPGARS